MPFVLSALCSRRRHTSPLRSRGNQEGARVLSSTADGRSGPSFEAHLILFPLASQTLAFGHAQFHPGTTLPSVLIFLLAYVIPENIVHLLNPV